MSSSTSSSKRAAWYTLLLAAITVLPAMALVHGFTRSAEQSGGDIFGIQRIRSVTESMDVMAHQAGPTLLVVGSSLVRDGFSPRLFDAAAHEAGASVTSFNVGMGNMKPAYLKILMRRLADAHQAAGTRAALTLVEFNPFLVTNAREQFRPFMTEQIQAVLMSADEVWDTMWRDPDQWARLMSIKYLRYGVSAEAITGGLRLLVNQAQAQAPVMAQLSQQQLDQLQQLAAHHAQLNHQIRVDQPLTYKSHVWNPLTQGGLVDLMDLSESTQATAKQVLVQMRDPALLALDLQSREDCCDIVNLSFNDKLISDFLATVEHAQAFSDRVEVVLMPRNTAWVQPSPEGQQRLQTQLNAIAQHTGVTVRNYQAHPAFSASAFYDVTHLSIDEGRPLFSRILARDLAEYFKQQE